MKKSITIISGGLDSTVLAYLMAGLGYQLHFVSFDYGQRHRRELGFAARTADALGARHDIIDLSGLGQHLSGSALTDPAVPVPDGQYFEESMKATIVPNRNAIMLALAYGMGFASGAEVIAYAAHAGDHFIYPDCRPEFIRAFEQMEKLALDASIELFAPFQRMTKTQIVQQGHDLGVPFADTYSCYNGGEIHCGTCGTCTERREAFEEAGIPDPTQYR